MKLNILNQNEELVTTLSDSIVASAAAPLIEATCREMLNDLHEITFITTADSEEAAKIKEDYYVVAKVDDTWREFIVDSVKETDDTSLLKEVKASLSSVELADHLLENELVHSSKDARVLLSSMLKGTRWEVGYIDAAIREHSLSKDVRFLTVLEGIYRIVNDFDCDVHFTYEISGNKITKRKVNLYANLGNQSGKRFEIDKDVTSIERLIDTTQIKTAVYPIKSASNDDKAVVTTIADVVWSKAKGDPADKPKGQKWVGDPAALANWGRRDKSGNLLHRFKLYEFQEEVSPEEMLKMSWVSLGRYTKPTVTYSMTVADLYSLYGEDYAHEKIVLGDYCTVIDHYFAVPVTVSERVIEVERNLLNQTDTVVVLGESKADYTSDRTSMSEEANNALTAAKEADKNASIALESADGKNTNYYGSVEASNPKEGDLWFRPDPDDLEEEQMLQYDGFQWILRASTKELTLLAEEIEKAMAEAEQAKKDAQTAYENAVAAAEVKVTEAGKQWDKKLGEQWSKTTTEITKAQQDTLAKAELSVEAAEVRWDDNLAAVKEELDGKLTKLPDALINQAWIDKLYASEAFITNFNAKSIQAVSANINEIITQHLNANIITASHIKSDTALIDKIFATTANIDQLFSKQAFITNLSAKSIEAISANITSIITDHLAADAITSKHIKADNATIDKLFANEALITRLTSKTAFINNIKAIEISANKIVGGTIDASKINVINLNAGNLTSGYVNANRIAAKSITADKISATTLSAITANLGTVNAGTLNGVNIIGASIRTFKGSGAVAYVEISGGAVMLKNSGGTIMGEFTSQSVAGGAAVLTNRQGQILRIGTSNGSSLGTIIDIPSNSTTSNPLANFYGRINLNTGFKLYPNTDTGITRTGTRGMAIGVTDDVLEMGYQSGTYMKTTMLIGCRSSGTQGVNIYGGFNVTAGKNAIHGTRDGIRATPAYELAESYLGDIGRSYTRENCEVWVPIDLLFSDTVNTDIAYEVFLQAYDNASFWVADFKPDRFLIKSDKPMARFAWEIKAKRRGFENERLVTIELSDKEIENAWRNE